VPFEPQAALKSLTRARRAALRSRRAYPWNRVGVTLSPGICVPFAEMTRRFTRPGGQIGRNPSAASAFKRGGLTTGYNAAWPIDKRPFWELSIVKKVLTRDRVGALPTVSRRRSCGYQGAPARSPWRGRLWVASAPHETVAWLSRGTSSEDVLVGRKPQLQSSLHRQRDLRQAALHKVAPSGRWKRSAVTATLPACPPYNERLSYPPPTSTRGVSCPRAA
jgi:hypothetical protein